MQLPDFVIPCTVMDPKRSQIFNRKFNEFSNNVQEFASIHESLSHMDSSFQSHRIPHKAKISCKDKSSKLKKSKNLQYQTDSNFIKIRDLQDKMKEDLDESECDITNTKTLLDICKIEHNKMQVLQNKDTENNSTVSISLNEQIDSNVKVSREFGNSKQTLKEGKITVLDEQGRDITEKKHKKDKMSEEMAKSLERFNLREQAKLKLFDPKGLNSVRDSPQRSDH